MALSDTERAIINQRAQALCDRLCDLAARVERAATSVRDHDSCPASTSKERPGPPQQVR
jgi:uncharacterized protein YukE